MWNVCCCSHGGARPLYQLVAALATILTIQVGVASFIPPCFAELVAAAVLPHGDFAWDPSLVPSTRFAAERHAADQIALSARRAGRWLLHHVRPDVIAGFLKLVQNTT
jgi:hypothetical protein